MPHVPIHRDDPLVDLGGSGPSTLTDLYGSEVSYVDQASRGLSTGLRPGQFTFSGRVPDTGDLGVSPETFQPPPPAFSISASGGLVPSIQTDAFGGYTPPPAEDTSYLYQSGNPTQDPSTAVGSDWWTRNLEQAARVNQQQQAGTNAATQAAQAGNLQDVFNAIAADSGTIFGTLIDEAGARGQATAEAIGATNQDIDQRLAGTGEAVSRGGGAGGLSGQVLGEAAQAESSNIRDLQTALGGFLQQSQLRRTNATQDYLSGLQGQSQITMDRARTLGEFTIAQQRAIAEQERARTENDIAADTAADQITRSLLGGLDLNTFNALPDEVQDLYIERQQEATAGTPGEERTPGVIGQELAEAGVSEEALQPLEILETNSDRWFQSLTPEEQAMVQDDDVPASQKAKMFADDNFVVVADDNPNVNSFVNVGGQRRLAITADDWRKYLQWAGQ